MSWRLLPLVPLAEALVAVGTLHQFMVERQPIDAMEMLWSTSQSKLKFEPEQRPRFRTRAWQRLQGFLGWVTRVNPPSRLLVQDRNIAKLYEAGFAGREFDIRCLAFRGDARNTVVEFPSRSDVILSDRKSIAWFMLSIGTLIIALWHAEPAVNRVFHGCGEGDDWWDFAADIILILGYVCLLLANRYRVNSMHNKFYVEARKVLNKRAQADAVTDARDDENQSMENPQTC